MWALTNSIAYNTKQSNKDFYIASSNEKILAVLVEFCMVDNYIILTIIVQKNIVNYQSNAAFIVWSKPWYVKLRFCQEISTCNVNVLDQL